MTSQKKTKTGVRSQTEGADFPCGRMARNKVRGGGGRTGRVPVSDPIFGADESETGVVRKKRRK